MSRVGTEFEHEGTVTRLFVNPTKKPGVNRYSFVLKGEDKQYYNTATKNPNVEPGDVVSFVVAVDEYNGKEQLNVQVSSIVKRGSAPVATPAVATKPAFVAKAGGFGARDEMDLKNRMTAWHAARGAAVEILSSSGEISDLDEVHQLSVRLYNDTISFLLPKKEEVVTVDLIPEMPLPVEPALEAIAKVIAESTTEVAATPKKVGRFNF